MFGSLGLPSSSCKYPFVTFETRRATGAAALREYFGAEDHRYALQDAFNLILIGNYKERVIGGMMGHFSHRLHRLCRKEALP